ncbi:MAG TPA: hypothetical protein PLH94_10575 [Fimbriimonadaceae bacterium]|nr:hypothetical protein [Fimbriimonadaceae bacterium]
MMRQGWVKFVLATVIAAGLAGCGGTGINFIDNFQRVVVEPAGRQFSAFASRIRVDVPPGTFSRSVTFLISQALGLPTLARILLESAFDLRVEGAFAEGRITLRLRYNLRDLPSGIEEASLRLFRWVDGELREVVGSRVLPDSGYVEGEVEDPNGTFVVAAAER